MFRFILRVFKYGFLTTLAAAVVAKFVLESRAGPENEEVDIVSIFGGTHLPSTAQPFYGGKITNMFGGTSLDLRRVDPAPTGIYLDLAVVFGGVSITVPEGWRVRSELNITAGGFDDASRTGVDPDATTVNLTGFVVCGGVSVGTRLIGSEKS